MEQESKLKTLRILGALGTAIMMASPAQAEDTLSPAGRAKLAELVALVRDGPDLCNDNTTLGMDVIALYIGWGNQAPSENEIEAKQRELAACRTRGP